jgi:hypothetical protein
MKALLLTLLGLWAAMLFFAIVGVNWMVVGMFLLPFVCACALWLINYYE